MRKKVAIVIPSLRGGGAERVMVNVISNLDQDKFDPILIVIKKEGPYIDLLPKKLKVIDLNSDRVRHAIVRLINALNDFKPDVILSTAGHLNLAILSIRPLLKNKPKIIVREANTPSKNISNKEKLQLVLYKYLYSKADLIIAQCNDMKYDIIDSFKIEKSKIKTIYNPLDMKKIKESSNGESPYNSKNINFLSVGRLAPQKGFDILIKSFEIVINKIPSAHLTILGEGSLKQELQDQAEKLGIKENISFIGFRDNPYPYYYFSDMYILSSRWEGFPNTLLEAMACGTKVVATNCKSGPREILGDNEYGTLVEEGDYRSLANGIIKSISEKNKTGDRANFFHIDNIIKEYEKVLLK